MKAVFMTSFIDMYDMIKPIESKQPLAITFNKVISKITTLWIISRPRTFEDIKGEEATFKITTFYQIVLWEKWLHEIVLRLQEWTTIINEFFNDFNGSWKYYALSKRLDYIDEFGTDADEDLNPDGSIKTTGITHEQLKYHTVFQNLYHDGVDIVQDTHPTDIYPLIEAINVNAHVSIVDILRKVSGKEQPCYIIGDEGNLRPITFEEKELHKAMGMVEAHDYGQIILIVALLMEKLTNEIEVVANSEKAFADNHELLYNIQRDAEAILSLTE